VNEYFTLVKMQRPVVCLNINWLNDHCTLHEQRGFILLNGLRDVRFLAPFLLPAFMGPVPLLALVVTLIISDVAASATTTVTSALAASIACIAVAVVTSCTTTA
jgi:hypothetical protein